MRLVPWVKIYLLKFNRFKYQERDQFQLNSLVKEVLLMKSSVKSHLSMNVLMLLNLNNLNAQCYSRNVISTELVSTCVMPMDIKNYRLNNKEQFCKYFYSNIF